MEKISLSLHCYHVKKLKGITNADALTHNWGLNKMWSSKCFRSGAPAGDADRNFAILIKASNTRSVRCSREAWDI